MKIKPTEINEKRARMLLAYFENGRTNRNISFDILKKHLTEEVSDSIIRDSLYLANTWVRPGFHISVSPKNRTGICKQTSETSDVKNNQEYAATKKAMGELLWKKLLDLGHLPQHKSSFVESKSIRNKITVLRRRGMLSLVADAGTTTCAAVEALLNVDYLPLQPASVSPGNARFIRPVITTNSLRISNLVANHRHANEIELRLIGGSLRQDRASFCGPLAEMALNAIRTQSDITLVGTTGYRSAYDGTPSFGADDISESRIKTALLETSSLLRVVIFHSEKLKYPEVSSIFAALSPDSIDLVVTDDGKVTDAKDEVRDFLETCRIADVATLMLKSP
jgi:DeoR/GlpR family transcriptional regulator of sugar metabolism